MITSNNSQRGTSPQQSASQTKAGTRGRSRHAGKLPVTCQKVPASGSLDRAAYVDAVSISSTAAAVLTRQVGAGGGGGELQNADNGPREQRGLTDRKEAPHALRVHSRWWGWGGGGGGGRGPHQIKNRRVEGIACQNKHRRSNRAIPSGVRLPPLMEVAENGAPGVETLFAAALFCGRGRRGRRGGGAVGAGCTCTGLEERCARGPVAPIIA